LPFTRTGFIQGWSIVRFDFLIVGAGFAGAVLAERIATQLNKKVLVVDKRNHIGGNAFDFYDENGILVHKYGPHILSQRYRSDLSKRSLRFKSAAKIHNLILMYA